MLATKEEKKVGATMLAVMKSERKAGAKIGEAPMPTIGPRDLLVKVKATSICGTDAHIYQWDAWANNRIQLKTPFVFGHEFCGEVIQIGDQIKDFALGDFVSGESHIPCLSCFQCQNNQMHICQNIKALGVDVNGCFAEYLSIPAVCAWKNPPDMAPEIATLQEPLGNAVYATLAEDVAGKSVAIFGCGPSGLFSVGVAAASGAGPIISVIKHDFRRKIAEAMGATQVLRTGEKNIPEEISKLTHGQGIDVVIEMTGKPQAIHDAFQIVKKGGRVTVYGLPNEPVPIDLAKDVIFKGIRIYGIYGREMYQTWYKMKNLLTSGKLDPRPVITHRFALTEFEQGMQAMIASDRRSGKIVLFP